MIQSCQECKTKCCKVGPGPYDQIPVDQYLENFESFKNYNKVCIHFSIKTGLCGLWNSDLLPDDCRNYVCFVREFSEQELAAIVIGTNLKGTQHARR